MEKDNSIIEGNKLIAEFMGHVQNDEGFWTHPDGYWKNHKTEHFLFHSSWGSIMPVVDKIEAIPKTAFQYQSFENGHAQILISVDGTVQSGIMFDKDQKREAHFTAIVKFIQWYNQQSP